MGSWKVVFAPVRQWLDALGTICFFFHGMRFAVLEQFSVARSPQTLMGFKQDLKNTFSLRGMSATQLVKRVIAEVQKDNCAVYAAALAYYFLFALFPFFLFLTALLGYLPIPNLMDRIIGLLGQVMPGEALSLVEENVAKLVSQQRGGLLSFGIVAALWTSSSALTGISDSLNHAYDF